MEGLIAVIAICRRRRLFILISIPFFFLRWFFSALVSKGHLSRLNTISVKAYKLCWKGAWLAFKMDGELCAEPELGAQSAGLVNRERFTSWTVSSR